MTAAEFQILQDRWAKYVQCGAPGECWLWQGYRQPNGYGWLNASKFKIAAHRAALLLAGIEVPKGMDACHRCDNRACVNPSHLYVGTRRQNMADCTARNRHNKPRGAAHWRAKLTESDVRLLRQLKRQGQSLSALARRFNINSGTVSRIARGIWRGEVA